MQQSISKSNCVFCQIIAGNLPCYKIYEDDSFLSFLDIFPKAKGHTLVIPKKHIRWVYDVKNFSQYWNVVLKITRSIQKSVNPYFINYVTHGLDIPHAHIHIIPKTADNIEYITNTIKMSGKQLTQIANIISKKI